ncbi:DUF4312 family protein [Lactiplantibacillus garii]|uniref:DUF4312 family protein n=1 Tax=Lactiplantibacillus garii TaxID=2306423 RepID=A0A426D4T5_9LACO|nr:DUF4312 family protein [Lactiplantibacillus garii]RRK09601.1 DUF4312 family protein [Lactiplantibacillus garii]
MATSINATHQVTVRVAGKGETKQKAFANALSQIQKQVVDNTDQVTLQIVPVKVIPVRLRATAYRERFLFLFFPRTRTAYHVTLDIVVSINSVDLATVPFQTTAPANADFETVSGLKGGK